MILPNELDYFRINPFNQHDYIGRALASFDDTRVMKQWLDDGCCFGMCYLWLEYMTQEKSELYDSQERLNHIIINMSKVLFVQKITYYFHTPDSPLIEGVNMQEELEMEVTLDLDTQGRDYFTPYEVNSPYPVHKVFHEGSRYSGEVCIILLAGPEGAHAMGMAEIYSYDPPKFLIFDPNYGEFVVSHKVTPFMLNEYIKVTFGDVDFFKIMRRKF